MIDKRLLTDTVTIQKVLGKDNWGKVTYAEAEVLSPVKFDREVAHVGTANHRDEKKASVLFVFPRYCPVVLDQSYLDGLVTCDDLVYTIRKIIPQYQPFTQKLLCYEVEVV